jgi:endonuclease-8
MEGPHIALFAQQLAPLAGVPVVEAGGEARVDLAWLAGAPLPRAFSRGKLLFLPFDQRALRIHFLMFGDLRIDREWPGKRLTLFLRLANGTILRCYMSSVQIAETAAIDALYPARLDIMSPEWDRDAAVAAMDAAVSPFLCDLLLDQAVFMGVGNKMKNEILWNLRVHPLESVAALDADARRGLAGETRAFAHLFYDTIAAGASIDTRTAVYKKKTCPRCGSRLVREHLGATPRVCFTCPVCQPRPPADARCTPAVTD